MFRGIFDLTKINLTNALQSLEAKLLSVETRRHSDIDHPSDVRRLPTHVTKVSDLKSLTLDDKFLFLLSKLTIRVTFGELTCFLDQIGLGYDDSELWPQVKDLVLGHCPRTMRPHDHKKGMKCISCRVQLCSYCCYRALDNIKGKDDFNRIGSLVATRVSKACADPDCRKYVPLVPGRRCICLEELYLAVDSEGEHGMFQCYDCCKQALVNFSCRFKCIDVLDMIEELCNCLETPCKDIQFPPNNVDVCRLCNGAVGDPISHWAIFPLGQGDRAHIDSLDPDQAS